MSVYSQNFNGVTPPALPAGFTASTASFVTTAAQHVSASANSLTLTGGSNSVQVFMGDTQDGALGNQSVKCAFALDSDAVDGIVIGRANSNTNPTDFVYLRLKTFAAPYGITMGEYTGGVESDIKGPNSALTGHLTGTPDFYSYELDITGNVARGYVQRLSDGFWMQRDSTFANTARVPVLSMIVSSPAAGTNSYAGAGFQVVPGTSIAKNLFLGSISLDNAAAASPAEYFIDSVSGNDANNGLTVGTAWQTMAKAQSYLDTQQIPGDTLCFLGAAGQTAYSGNLFVSVGGTSLNPFTITSLYTAGNQPQISAGDLWGVRVYNAGYTIINDLHLSGPGIDRTTGATTSGGAGAQPAFPAFDGTGIDIFADTSTGANYAGCEVTNCLIEGFYSGIIVRSTPQTSGTNADGQDSLVFTNNLIHDCLHTGINTQGGNSTNTSGSPFFFLSDYLHKNAYIANNELHDIPGDPNSGIWSGVCMQLNNLDGTTFDGVRGTCSLIERNVCYNSVYLVGTNVTPPGGGGGIIPLASRRVTVQNNECHHLSTVMVGDSCGFDIDGGCTECLMQNNYSHHNYGAGFQSGKYPNSLDTTLSVIRYNVSTNDCLNPQTQGGGTLPQCSLFDFGSSTLWYANTAIVGTTSASIKPTCIGSAGPGGVTAGQWVDNILITNVTGNTFTYTGDTGATLLGNRYYAANGAVASWRLGGANYASLSAIQTAGYEKLSGSPVGSTGDPSFVNIAFTGTLGIGHAPQGNLSAFNLLSTSDAGTAGIDATAAGISSALLGGKDMANTIRLPASQAVGAGRVTEAPSTSGVVGFGRPFKYPPRF